MSSFRELIRGELIVAPCALNPIMARIAEEAGFKAVYMSGGSLGWLKCVTEANITLPEMAEIAVDIRAVCRLPIILDAGGGWGDPMHVHRTIALTQAAGFSAIEIEDQLLPRRVEHHIGIDNLVDTGLMVDKIKEAIAARTDPNLVIIARTNTRRVHGLDDALRRGEAFHRAGADVLFIYTRDAALRGRTAAGAADDLRAAGRICDVRAVALRSVPAWLSGGRFVGHLLRRHAQGGAPIDGMSGGEPARLLPRAGRRRDGDETVAPDLAARGASRNRAAHHEGAALISLGIPKSVRFHKSRLQPLLMVFLYLSRPLG